MDALPADERYVFYKEIAYERIMSGDCKILPTKLAAQIEYIEEIRVARALKPVPNAAIEDLDIDKLNYYIQLSNAEIKIQNILPTIQDAIPFLTRNGMMTEKVPTILGMLVCGHTPADFLHWRSQVDAYVDMPIAMPINKKIINDNILPLLEQSQAFVFRNIQTGLSLDKGGSKTFEYPEELIRESINNALAHRDYSVNQFVNINIVPAKHIQIKNPGRFKQQLLIIYETTEKGIKRIDETTEVDIKRIVPIAKANNPKLARVLSVYNKWEGKGRGMKNLVSAALDGHIDLPYYVFHSRDELSLYIPKGKLVDERMETLFDCFSKYLARKTDEAQLTTEQKSVFAYFYKSELQNKNNRFTLLLTQDNNHLEAINFLVDKGLLIKHKCSDYINVVYIVDRLFVKDNFYKELKAIFKNSFDLLSTEYKQVVNAIYLYINYSLKDAVSANLIGNYLFYKQQHAVFDLKKYETFKRKVRNQFNSLEAKGYIKAIAGKNKGGVEKTLGYDINNDFSTGSSLFD